MSKQLCHRTYSYKKRHKELGPQKRSKEWAVFYGSRAWKLLRDSFIYEHPLCAECLKEGISRQAEAVHHRIPFGWFAENYLKWKAFLWEGNLVPLCKHHHEEIHKDLHRPDDFENSLEYKVIKHLKD